MTVNDVVPYVPYTCSIGYSTIIEIIIRCSRSQSLAQSSDMSFRNPDEIPRISLCVTEYTEEAQWRAPQSKKRKGTQFLADSGTMEEGKIFRDAAAAAAAAAAVSLPAAGLGGGFLGDREERCRNENRSRIVVVVHPIMRLARHFRSRAANNPFSTWEALIIVWRDERNGRRRRGGKRQGHGEQISGRGRGRQPFGRGERRSVMPFYFFRKLIEIARDHLPIDLFRGRTNQINQRE
ncbi:hypothetical protein ALC56_14386 [Trachymyrmex septentrionalis]|uniref:Uncharacterized protein n=1 Tax=Trachymyrmex septentrionalis TaxID=34720 RepID=A0A195ETC8_9HYME|nr:hypothetical protein ALC56_14386 [Trachymyrmex septentrionalis]